MTATDQFNKATPREIHLFRRAAYARDTEYFIPAGGRKVLISLATHLDDPYIAQMAIAKVVKLCREGQIQDACILNFERCIILQINRTSKAIIKVLRTAPLRMLDVSRTPGLDSLIALLSNNPTSNKNTFNVPSTVLERLIGSMAGLSKESMPNFNLSSEQFASIRDQSLVLPNCTILAFPTGCDPTNTFRFAVNHANKKIEVVLLGRERRGHIESGRPTVSESTVLIDGANVGLTPVRIEALMISESVELIWNIDLQSFMMQVRGGGEVTNPTSDNFDSEEGGKEENVPDNGEESQGESKDRGKD